MTEYSEIEAASDDPEGRVLDALADGQPYAFLVATEIDPDLRLRLASNHSVSTIRALLNQALRALPES
ncbi:MAG: hypothetical protein ABWY81_10955 [Jiangellaceae bacterium]